MHFFGCLLGLVLGIVFVFLNLGFRLWWNIRNIFRGTDGNTSGSSTYNRSYGHTSYSNTTSTSGSQQQSQSDTTAGSTTSHSSHSKVFADNEGEYVDFEEVNE